MIDGGFSAKGTDPRMRLVPFDEPRAPAQMWWKEEKNGGDGGAAVGRAPFARELHGDPTLQQARHTAAVPCPALAPRMASASGPVRVTRRWAGRASRQEIRVRPAFWRPHRRSRLLTSSILSSPPALFVLLCAPLRLPSRISQQRRRRDPLRGASLAPPHLRAAAPRSLSPVTLLHRVR
jgi:hypothetical protein